MTGLGYHTLSCAVLNVKPWALCLLGKHSIHWVISLTLPLLIWEEEQMHSYGYFAFYPFIQFCFSFHRFLFLAVHYVYDCDSLEHGLHDIALSLVLRTSSWMWQYIFVHVSLLSPLAYCLTYTAHTTIKIIVLTVILLYNKQCRVPCSQVFSGYIEVTYHSLVILHYIFLYSQIRENQQCGRLQVPLYHWPQLILAQICANQSQIKYYFYLYEVRIWLHFE